MDQKDWMSDSRLEAIEKSKLNLLQKLVFELNALSPKEKLPFILAMANKAPAAEFSKEETIQIIEVMKDYGTKEDLQKMNRILALFKEKN